MNSRSPLRMAANFSLAPIGLAQLPCFDKVAGQEQDVKCIGGLGNFAISRAGRSRVTRPESRVVAGHGSKVAWSANANGMDPLSRSARRAAPKRDGMERA